MQYGKQRAAAAAMTTNTAVYHNLLKISVFVVCVCVLGVSAHLIYNF